MAMSRWAKHYRDGFKLFCKLNFGTEDLEKCREEMHKELKELWGGAE